MTVQHLIRLVPVLLGLLTLASCGGGVGEVSVSTLSASNARMGVAATITVSGRKLRDGISVAIEGPCENLTVVPNGSDDTQQYTCNVRGVGQVRAVVTDSGGVFLARLAFEVPTPQVSVVTSLGTFVLDLQAEKAPASTLNFLAYVNAGFYRNVIIDRAIPDRGMLTGGFTTGLAVKAPTRPAISLESNNGLKNLRGTAAFFRDAEPGSARARWFVNTADNADLDYVNEANPGYAVFAVVSSGLDIVDAITRVETRVDLVNQLNFVPVTEVLITSATQVR